MQQSAIHKRLAFRRRSTRRPPRQASHPESIPRTLAGRMDLPFLLLTILEVLLRGNMLPEQFLPARVLGILAGMGGIVVGFYTLQGVLGRNYDALNIALYFAGVLLSLFVENKRYRKSSLLSTKAAAAVLLLLTVAFFVFTYCPPDIGLFWDPTVGL